MDLLKELRQELNTNTAILLDTKGPEIRTGVLKGGKRIMLKAGEQKVVQFNIDENALKFYNPQLKYVAEPGEFEVMIGLDSQNVQQNSFQLL